MVLFSRGGRMAAENHTQTGGDAKPLVFALILLSLVIEGFDLQAANFAAPDVLRMFGKTRAEAGAFLSASLVGVLVGAALVGPWGDRIGRKRVIIACCVAYGLLSLAAAAVQSYTQLVALRFAVGIGLGGVLPNALALAGEFARPGNRARAMGLIGIGITLGGVFAGIVAARLIPLYGWRSLFVVGGILPIAIAALLGFGLPESPALAAGQKVERRRASVRLLFSPGVGSITVAIWLIFSAVLMSVYLLSGWIPLLMNDSGFSPAQASLIGSAYQAGGVIGGVVASLLLSRRSWPVVVLFAGCAAVALMALGARPWSPAAVVAIIVLVGFLVTGTQNAINGAGGDTYPAATRATGLGWALGIGRLGSIAGPLVGSLAVALGLHEPRHLFLVPVVPMAVAAVAAAWLIRVVRNSIEESPGGKL
jgi:AAHS family 4-hydroxybenzoate transporter-like MFS transporter